MRTSSSGSEREEFDDKSSRSEEEVIMDTSASGSKREEFDDTSSRSEIEESDDTDHEEKVSGEPSFGATGAPFDGRIRRKKIDVPEEIMNIVKRYTKWQTMEELDTAQTEISGVSSEFDCEDLKIELVNMQDLSSKLGAYNFSHACDLNTLNQAVEKALHQIVDKFPGIQSMDAYNLLSKENKYRIEVTLYYKLLDGEDGEVDSVPQDTTDAERCAPDPADAEKDLKQLLYPLVSDMEKVRALSKLCAASAEVGSRVRSFIRTLEATIYRCSRFMENGRDHKGVNLAGQADECQKSVEEDENKGRDHKRVKLAGPAEEGRESVESWTLTKEKFQSLCKVMKEVLGARVEDVVVSDRLASSSSCFLRDSCRGGKIMEINPEHPLIKDLHKRLYAGRNDLHVKTVALVLFNYANGQRVRMSVEKLDLLQRRSYGVCNHVHEGMLDCMMLMKNQDGVQRGMEELMSVASKLKSVLDDLRRVQCSIDGLMMFHEESLNLEMFQDQYMKF